MFLRRMKSLVFGLTFSVATNAEEVLRLLLSPVPGLARALVLVPVLASALELLYRVNVSESRKEFLCYGIWSIF